MKEFVTAAEQVAETQEPDLVFSIDGFEMHAYKPTEGQFALLMMSLGRHASNREQFAGAIDFFFNMLDGPSQEYMVDRMQSREGVIPIDKIIEVLEWMVEEWGGRPFQSPSVSTSSRRNGGRKSTAATPAST